MSDIKKLLDLINENPEEECDYYDQEVTRIHEFLDAYGFKPGKVAYNKYILEALWMEWIGTESERKLRVFRKELLKILPSKWEYTVYLDEEAFTVDKKDLAKIVGKLMFQGRYGSQKSKTKKKN